MVTCFMDWNIEFLLSLAMFESFTTLYHGKPAFFFFELHFLEIYEG